MAFSTTPSAGADRLRATADGQTINALGGNDWLFSAFNASALYGGLGSDRISVALGDPAPEVADNIAEATLFGGNGNDWLVSDFVTESADGFSYGFTSRQSGGAGNDNIHVTAEGRGRGRIDLEVLGGAGNDDIWIEEDTGSSTNTNIVDAGGGADTIYIASQVSSVGSEEGTTTNVVEAGAGDDDVFVYGEAGWLDDDATNTVSGGEGNDRIEAHIGGSIGTNTLDGGDGDDTLIAIGSVSAEVSAGVTSNVTGGSGSDVIEMNSTVAAILPVIVHRADGDSGDDIITSRAEIIVSEEGDTATADARLDGGSGNDTLTATTIFDVNADASGGARLYGRTGNDVLRVYGGIENTLDGGTGDDTITGGSGNDRIVGGAGADTLRSGDGEDAFVYLWMNGAGVAARDTIRGFGFGDDVIDLSAIDANASRGGNQGFTFGGGTGVGRAWVENSETGTASIVRANNGGSLELYITVEDGAGRDASDWSADDFLL